MSLLYGPIVYGTIILYDSIIYYFCIVFSFGEHPNKSAFCFSLCFMMKTYFLQLYSYLHSLFFIGFLVLDSAPEFTKIITCFFIYSTTIRADKKNREIFSSKPVMSKKISDCLLLQFELVFPVRYNFSSSNSI